MRTSVSDGKIGDEGSSAGDRGLEGAMVGKTVGELVLTVVGDSVAIVGDWVSIDFIRVQDVVERVTNVDWGVKTISWVGDDVVRMGTSTRSVVVMWDEVDETFWER